MVDGRTNFDKDISTLVRETYGGSIKVFNADIPRSVKAAEISAEERVSLPMTQKVKLQKGMSKEEAEKKNPKSNNRPSVLDSLKQPSQLDREFKVKQDTEVR